MLRKNDGAAVNASADELDEFVLLEREMLATATPDAKGSSEA
jgi:hypothetical protein